MPSSKSFVKHRLTQGSKKWLAWRLSGIGASDAATIMGENPWKGRDQLLQEKISGIDAFKGNALTRQGQALEPLARERYQKIKRVKVEPAAVQSCAYEWQLASLDGLSQSGKVVVEIKCGKRAYEIASQQRKVPRYYYGQLQHILSATGLESVDFFCYWPNMTPVLLSLERDEDYIDDLVHEEQAFWNKVLKGRKRR